jgi:general stress protein CsbA
LLELWLIIVGSLVHQLYDWSGQLWAIGLFAPVDESVWEHFKLGYAAILLWMPVERLLLRRGGNTYAFARAAGVIALNLVVVLVFFTIRPWFDESVVLAVDIGSYIAGCLVMGQIVRRCSDLPSPLLHRIGAPAFLLLAGLFAGLTIWKPDAALFVEHAW